MPEGAGEARRHPELDIEFDPRFERRSHVVQMALWGLMGAAILASVLGAFGTGLWSDDSATAHGQPSIKVRYDSTVRLQSENEIIVEVSDPPPEPADTVEIEISRSLWADIHLTEVNPDAEGVTVTDDSYIYEFKVDDWNETITVFFEFRYDHWGTVGGDFQARAGDSESPVVSISQFVFP
jgi:hypothetical protein